MLTGKEKAQILLSVLGDQSQKVLEKLSPEKSQMLMSSIGEIPSQSQSDIALVLDEVLSESGSLTPEGGLGIVPPVGGNSDSLNPSGLPDVFAAEDSADESFDVGNLDASPSDEDMPEDNIGLDVSDEEIADPLLPKKRTSSEVARLLELQRPQMAAFVLAKLDEEERQKIVELLDIAFRAKVESIDVDNLPLSDSIFMNIFDQVFFVQTDEEVVQSTDFDMDTTMVDIPEVVDATRSSEPAPVVTETEATPTEIASEVNSDSTDAGSDIEISEDLSKPDLSSAQDDEQDSVPPLPEEDYAPVELGAIHDPFPDEVSEDTSQEVDNSDESGAQEVVEDTEASSETTDAPDSETPEAEVSNASEEASEDDNTTDDSEDNSMPLPFEAENDVSDDELGREESSLAALF